MTKDLNTLLEEYKELNSKLPEGVWIVVDGVLIRRSKAFLDERIARMDSILRDEEYSTLIPLMRKLIPLLIEENERLRKAKG